VFFYASPYSKNNVGLPDGMKVHKSRTLFSTGPGGVIILSPEGKLLGIIQTSKATANIAFGPEYKFMFLTPTDRLLRVKLK
jgi:gluconolactonase